MRLIYDSGDKVPSILTVGTTVDRCELSSSHFGRFDLWKRWLDQRDTLDEWAEKIIVTSSVLFMTQGILCLNIISRKTNTIEHIPSKEAKKRRASQ